MIVYKTGEMIIIIKFKKITLYVDGESSIFLGNIKANEIGIYFPSDEILLNKFNVTNWDTITNNLIHIKFLVKYSPILSKFVDSAEFDTIEFTPSSDNVVDNWSNVSYVNLNDGKEFLNVYDISYDVSHTGQDVISIKIDSEFLKILKKQKFH